MLAIPSRIIHIRIVTQKRTVTLPWHGKTFALCVTTSTYQSSVPGFFAVCRKTELRNQPAYGHLSIGLSRSGSLGKWIKRRATGKPLHFENRHLSTAIQFSPITARNHKPCLATQLGVMKRKSNQGIGLFFRCHGVMVSINASNYRNGLMELRNDPRDKINLVPKGQERVRFPLAVLLVLLFFTGCALDVSPRQKERAAREKWAVEHRSQLLVNQITINKR